MAQRQIVLERLLSVEVTIVHWGNPKGRTINKIKSRFLIIKSYKPVPQMSLASVCQLLDTHFRSEVTITAT